MAPLAAYAAGASRDDADAEEEEPAPAPLVWGVRRIVYQVDVLAGFTSFQTLVRGATRAQRACSLPAGCACGLS